MSYGTFTVSSAPGFGRQPPEKEKLPSSFQAPVNVASSGGDETVKITVSPLTSQR